MAYSDDGPSETCDKHVLVDFCVTGGGVATEYCHLFENAKVEKKALVKMTPAEIEQIRAACGNGLSSVYEDDKYVYYVSNTGEALDWHGFSGRANSNISAPYVVCPVHTKQAWEAYQAAHATEPEEEPTPGEE